MAALAREHGWTLQRTEAELARGKNWFIRK
jgi:hypothetical protein